MVGRFSFPFWVPAHLQVLIMLLSGSVLFQYYHTLYSYEKAPLGMLSSQNSLLVFMEVLSFSKWPTGNLGSKEHFQNIHMLVYTPWNKQIARANRPFTPFQEISSSSHWLSGANLLLFSGRVPSWCLKVISFQKMTWGDPSCLQFELTKIDALGQDYSPTLQSLVRVGLGVKTTLPHKVFEH